MTNPIRRPSDGFGLNRIAATAAPAPLPIGYAPSLTAKFLWCEDAAK